MPTLTYAELGAALGIAPASANKLARRRRWPRTKGNDGKTKVTVPEDALVRPPDSPRDSPQDSTPVSPSDSTQDTQLIKALESHVLTLREALAASEERLATADTMLLEERAKVTRAIEAFADLADRLDQLASERARPWWRRLTG
jgi:hypothetical protein